MDEKAAKPEEYRIDGQHRHRHVGVVYHYRATFVIDNSEAAWHAVIRYDSLLVRSCSGAVKVSSTAPLDHAWQRVTSSIHAEIDSIDI